MWLKDGHHGKRVEVLVCVAQLHGYDWVLVAPALRRRKYIVR